MLKYFLKPPILIFNLLSINNSIIVNKRGLQKKSITNTPIIPIPQSASTQILRLSTGRGIGPSPFQSEVNQ
jgi:hypothetical protein